LAVAVSASLWAASVQAQTAPMASPAPDPQATPKVGERARDFTLQSLDGSAVRLADEIARGPVVLVVLRGWPGYQCPFCTTQFSDYLKNAANFDARGAHVLFVYPGPAADLQEHAAAFLASRPMPQGFRFLLDPDYAMIGAYGLRWNAPKETSYPSTFVIDRHAMVAFAKTSRSHGDRVAADAVLTVLADSPR
jgi:peroxiredoxin